VPRGGIATAISIDFVAPLADRISHHFVDFAHRDLQKMRHTAPTRCYLYMENYE
jgi:hypothetical protein